MKLKKIMIYILTFVLCFGLTACGDGISNKDLQKIFIEYGLSPSEVKDDKIEKVINLENDIEGLDSSNYNKLILFTHDGKYVPVIVNTKTKKLTDIVTGFVPLNVVKEEIWNMGKDINIKNVAILKKYIERYGINGLEEHEYAEEYLREITGKGGIIDTEKAREVISNSTTQIFSNIDSADDITILFKDDNAVPMYYIGTETEMVYNWWSLWPEYQYEMVKASLDQNTLSRIAAMYGQPYVMQTVWVALDKYLNRLGTYDSFEDAKTKLLSKNTNETNNVSPAPKSTPKETENNSNANESNITNGSLVMYTNAELKPFEYYENGKMVGIDIDIAECIAKQLNMGIKIESVDFDALIPSLSSKKCDMVLSAMSETDERKKFVDFSTPYYDDCCIALNKDNTELNKKILEVYEKMKADGSIDNILNKYK